jgi:predicted transcriptional regulator
LGVTWRAPAPPEAGGAIVLAGLLGLAYWFWPHLKATGLLGLFTRVARHRALENRQRAVLYEAIERSPGVHFQELCRISGIGHGAVQHHLDQLLRTGLITRTKHGGYHCYFLADADRRLMAAAPAIKSTTAREILALIGRRPGIGALEVARRIEVTPASVNHHLGRFRSAGLVESIRNGSGISLRLTPAGKLSAAAWAETAA